MWHSDVSVWQPMPDSNKRTDAALRSRCCTVSVQRGTTGKHVRAGTSCCMWCARTWGHMTRRTTASTSRKTMPALLACASTRWGPSLTMSALLAPELRHFLAALPQSWQECLPCRVLPGNCLCVHGLTAFKTSTCDVPAIDLQRCPGMQRGPNLAEQHYIPSHTWSIGLIK